MAEAEKFPVLLEGFEAVAQIEAEGSRVTVGDKILVDGKLSLRIGTESIGRSGTVSPGTEDVVVEERGGDWYLVETERSIKFSKGSIRLASGDNPELLFKAISVGRIAGLAVELKADTFVAGLYTGLIDRAAPDLTNSLVIDSAGTPIGLAPVSHPNPLFGRGYWFQPDQESGELVFKCGKPSGAFLLKLANAVELRIRIWPELDCPLVGSSGSLRNDLTAASLRIKSDTNARPGSTLTVERSTELGFFTGKQGLPAQDKYDTEEIEISNKWCTVTKSDGARRNSAKRGIAIAKSNAVSGNTPDFVEDDQGFTRVDAADHESLKFCMWLDQDTPPVIDDQGAAMPRAMFVYHDKSASALTGSGDKGAERRKRYAGLRVRGMGHAGNKQLKLDGDWIVAPLNESGGRAVFEIEAGQENVPIPAARPFLEEASLLGFRAPTGNAIVIDKTSLRPKTNPSRGNRREAKIPAGNVMAVDLGAEGGSGFRDGESLRLTTKDGLLRISNAVLYGPPNGVTAKRADAELAGGVNANDWSLNLTDALVLKSSDTGMTPEKGEKWTDDFAGSQQTFEFKEYPGTGITMDPGIPPEPLRPLNGVDGGNKSLAANEPRCKLKIRPGTDREHMVYGQIFSKLAYKAVGYVIPDTSNEIALDDTDIALRLEKIVDTDAPKYWFPTYVTRNFGVDDLVIVYYCGNASDSPDEARKRFKEFARINKAQPDSSNPKRVVWPFLPGIAVTLADVKSNQHQWFWDLSKDRLPAGRSKSHAGLAFDLSTKGGAGLLLTDVPKDSVSNVHKLNNMMGLKDGAALGALAKKYPMIFPKDGDKDSSKRLDPRNPRWRGILFRDMPMQLNLSEKVTDNELFSDLAADIKERLLLQIGWKDETGASWVAGLEHPGLEGKKLKSSWTGICEIFLKSFSSTGSAGKPITTGGVLFFKLPKLKKKGSTEVFTVRTSFVLNVTNGVEIERIAVSANEIPDLPTVSIPGFKRLKLKSLLTDLKNADFRFQLFSTDELAKVFPFLKGDNPLDARLRFNFKGPRLFDLVLRMPAEEDTKLFGRWPFSLQGMRIKFDPGEVNSELIASGVLNLGPGPLSGIGLTLTVRFDADKDLSIKVRIDEIGGTLDFGKGFYASGGLRWGEKPDTWVGKPQPPDIESVKLNSDVNNRDIWGFLNVKTEVFGDAAFYLRVAERGETSFWVGAMQVPVNVPIGVGELRDPFFFIARNADRTTGSKLADVLGDVTKPIRGNLRIETKRTDQNKPPEWDPKPLDWLSNWEYSGNIGTVYAGSAYLHLHDQLAASTSPDKSKLTSIAFSDGGLLRIDGYTRLFKGFTFAVAVGVDYPRSRFSIGVQLPEVAYPPQSPTFSISAGVLAIAVGFGDKKYLKGSLGWPLSGGENPIPDWTKAVKVHWADAWPINTLWGGLEFEMEVGGRSDLKIRNGIALRAGWTRTYSEGFSGVASASASLTVAVGGSVVYTLRIGGDVCPSFTETGSQVFEDVIAPSRRLRREVFDARVARAAHLSHQQALSQQKREKAAKELAAAEAIAISAELLEKDVFAIASGFSLAMSSSLYATVSGSASAEFLGFTVASVSIGVEAAFKVCGDTCDGITEVKSSVYFDVTVEIACVSHTTTASREIYLVNKGVCRASLVSLL